MARDFFLLEPTYDIPTLENLRSQWNSVPDREIREIVAVEEQYLNFFKYLLSNLRHTMPGYGRTPPNDGLPIVAGIRSVAIKSALMTMCSIMEAVLLAHAIKCNYQLPPKKYARTFGKILEAWENNLLGKQTLGKYLRLIKYFKSTRDNFHLTKTVCEDPSFYKKMLEKEQLHLLVAERVLDFLKTIKSS